MHTLSPLPSIDFTLNLAYKWGQSTPLPLVTPSKFAPHCWIPDKLLSIDWSCHPDQHPWPPSVTEDPWRGKRFKWFFSNSRQPVFLVSWLLMATLEKGIMEILKTICPFDWQTRMSAGVGKEEWINFLNACNNTVNRLHKDHGQGNYRNLSKKLY